MGKIKDNYNELQLGFLKTVKPNSFSKFLCVSEFKCNTWDNFFCLLQVISLLTPSLIASGS